MRRCAPSISRPAITPPCSSPTGMGVFTLGSGLRFTFDSESAAMEFRLTHADHILDVEPANAARSVLMSLEPA